MIDLKQEFESYTHIDAEALGFEDRTIPDNVRSSINLYNKALDSINAKSEDMAIIELKKAISLNPEFCQAMDLLGVCYLYINDYNKARLVYEKIMELKGSNIKATRLYKLIKEREASSPKKEVKTAFNKQPPVKEENKNIKNNNINISEKLNFLKGDLIKYICCVLLGAVIVLLCNIPLYLSKTDSSPVNKVDTEVETINKLNKQVTELKSSLSKLTKDYETLKSNKALLENELEYNKNVKKLSEAEGLANSRNYEAAADMLILMKDTKFSAADKRKYDKLFESIVPNAAHSAYNQGYSLCNSRKYNEAIEKLNKVRIYGDKWKFMDSALYKLGVAYKGINNNKEALELFQTVVKLYPKSQVAYYAQARIKEMANLSK
ncbi:tetratricopeptide repeat protein [Pseudobacteroides cellulosolvens]|uniref:Tetratricopeptide repeat-containing protein n=1 Tax=Pseudobacteroides cellulosolvens ATCC 35603 = DSM 2933 TaxID=398512 RepID=A0A0L6JRE3_9FIRM|nr:tetratricopeptide repeat protein [Pseudobacteroides cellulosolvens]KNY28245.1 Tetratricopeptide repeat-containing protein [Pseudobacteroides cellulosolvens ATCC 35603 = DSM 2933]